MTVLLFDQTVKIRYGTIAFGPAVSNMGSHGVVEEQRVLEHYANVAPQRALPDALELPAVEQDAPSIGS